MKSRWNAQNRKYEQTANSVNIASLKAGEFLFFKKIQFIDNFNSKTKVTCVFALGSAKTRNVIFGKTEFIANILRKN